MKGTFLKNLVFHQCFEEHVSAIFTTPTENEKLPLNLDEKLKTILSMFPLNLSDIHCSANAWIPCQVHI